MVLENCTAAADIISYCGVGGVCDNRTATCFCEVGFWHDAHTWGKAICVEKPPAASNVTAFVSLFLLLFLGKMTRMYTPLRKLYLYPPASSPASTASSSSRS